MEKYSMSDDKNRPMTQHPQDHEPFGADELDIDFNDLNLMKPCNWFQGSRTEPLPPDAQLEFEEKLSDIMEDRIEKAQDDSDVKDVDFNDPEIMKSDCNDATIETFL